MASHRGGIAPDELSARLAAWVARAPALPGPLDAPLDDATAAFCRARLRDLAAPGLIAAKLGRELPGTWEPLGRVLLVIAEHDVLGTVAGVLGAVATGNRLRVKARTTRALLEDLAAALGLDAGDCEILDWDSRDQDDTAVLAGIDAVLVAGGDAAIRHYRAVAPPGVRLIELGPRLGVAAIAGAVTAGDELDALAAALARDVTLFAQGVCSSPQLIFVDDAATARALRDRVLARALPPLPDTERLLQQVRAQELSLLARLGEAGDGDGDDAEAAVALDPRSGWGVTIARDPAHRLPRGFAFVVTADLAAALDAFARANRRTLQTLGTWGAVPDTAGLGFTHRCRIGRMHDRSVLAPHDGFLEFAALVRLISREDGA